MNYISILAIILSVIAIGMISVGGNQAVSSQITKEEIREIVREEIEQLVEVPSDDQGSRKESRSSALKSKKSGIDTRHLRSVVSQELENKFEDLKDSGELSELIGNSEWDQYQEVDVSHLSTEEEKIDFIMKKMKNARSFYHDSAVVNQLIDMGEDAIPALLKWTKNNGRNWVASHASSAALNKLLTEDHKDIILEKFKSDSLFPELISKFHFPEAKELVFEKFEKGGHIDQNVVDVAFEYDPLEAEEKIRKFITEGEFVGYAAEALLDRNEDIDISEELTKAAKRCDQSWEKLDLSKVMLRQGMAGGLDLAIDACEENDLDDYSRREALKQLRKFTGFRGPSQEMLKWINENRDNLVWDESSGKFK